MRSFSITCALPPDRVIFSSSPDARGTLDIVWSCLGVLLICTWSILHLNVPTQSTPNGKRQKYYRSTQRLFWKLMWMSANLIAPEWPLGKAFADFLSVKSTEERLPESQGQGDIPWSRTHVHFANMGGIALKFDKSTRLPIDMSQKGTSTNATQGQVDEPRLPETYSLQVAPTEGGDIEATAQCDVEVDGIKSMAPPDGSKEVLALRTLQENQIDTVAEESSQTQGDSDGGSGESVVERVPTEETNHRSKEGFDWTMLNEPDLSSLGGQNLPDPIKNNIRSMSKRGVFLRPTTLLSLMKRSSRQIGPTDLTLDKTNIFVVAEALQLLDLNVFRTSWEQRRFITSPRSWLRNLSFLQGSTWILDANQIVLAHEFGILESLPSLPQDDIEDRNKGDLFVKTVAVVQILWFAIHIITRLCTHRATTQLEILTFAYAVSTAITYILLLDRPKDVQYSMVITAERYPSYEEVCRLAVVGSTCFGSPRSSFWTPNNAVHADLQRLARGRDLEVTIGGAIAVFLLGGLHLLAWDFVFPTNLERIMWQTSSFITALALPVAAIFSMLMATVWSLFRPRVGDTYVHSQALDIISNSVGVLFAAIFLAARAFILFEAFYSLAFQPSDAFATTWSSSLPHIT